jgi:hypothetical protein
MITNDFYDESEPHDDRHEVFHAVDKGPNGNQLLFNALQIKGLKSIQEQAVKRLIIEQKRLDKERKKRDNQDQIAGNSSHQRDAGDQ